MNANLDPSKFRMRESRDSADNPNSTPLIVALDVTGSMGMIADVIAREGLGTLFEGAQGLLLDQNNTAMFPHVTRSNTGMKNVRELCALAKIDEIETYYVSRTYLTRHGAGPLPGHNPSMQFHDETNQPNPWQGALRFAPLDALALDERCAADYGSRTGYKLVLTHCDQLEPTTFADLYAHGPMRSHIAERK